MVLYIIALVVALLGVAGAVIPILPGALLSFMALLLSYLSPYSDVTMSEVLIMLLLSVVVSVVDYFLPIFLTKRLGGSQSGVWGATIGMVVGFIAFPPLGVFVCPILGAVMGEFIHDKEDVNRALKVGMASLLAFIFGTGVKFAFSIYILSRILSGEMDRVNQYIEQLQSLVW